MLLRMTRRLLGILAIGALAGFAADDLTGTWAAEVNLDAGSGSPTFEIKQQGNQLSGKYIGMFGEEPLKGTVDGKSIRFTFTVAQGGEKIEAVYEGTVEGPDSLKGKATYGSFASGTWTAKRKK